MSDLRKKFIQTKRLLLFIREFEKVIKYKCSRFKNEDDLKIKS